jgi:hypothetical protein
VASVQEQAAMLRGLLERLPIGLVNEADNQLGEIGNQAQGILGDHPAAADIAAVIAGVQDTLHGSRDALAVLQQRIELTAERLTGG